MAKELRLKGFPICPGIAIGRPYLYTIADEKIPEFSVPESQIDDEVARYQRALRNSRRDLISLTRRLQREGGSEAASILRAHLEITKDPLMTVQVEEKIRTTGKNTEAVFKSVIGAFEKKFSKISDQFFRERLQDVQDISRRIISHLRHHETCSLANVAPGSIIFAHELTPSDTAEANTQCIEAFVTRSGGETSHVAIMARAKGIPFVSNVDFPDFDEQPIQGVIVDGESGEVILNPTEETLTHYLKQQRRLKIQQHGLKKASQFHAETIDGDKIRLSINVELSGEGESMTGSGGDGIGLFRSESLFLAQGTFPTEEEQFHVYRSVVEKAERHPAVIRTFDIGGDKFGTLHPSRHEKNPFLGCRAIRLMLKEKNVFKSQIRAILRASAFGEVRILFPMISGLAELREAKALVSEVKKELRTAKIPFSRQIPVGCMIEVPSAAVISDILAKECDFLSIGTNDLVQYSLAVDRGNPAMSYLYTPAHPSILRLIRIVVHEGNLAGVPISVCGEIAADPRFTPLLLGLGVHELSVSTPSIPVIKNAIRSLCIVDAVEFAERILCLSTAEEVDRALSKNYEALVKMA